MTSLLTLLSDHNVWEEFFDYKLGKDLLTKQEAAAVRRFIDAHEYADISHAIANGTYRFSAPVKHMINKKDTGKKRTVYTFRENETMILKLLTFLLYKYDGAVEKNCYSFRKNFGAKRAVNAILATQGIGKMHTLKIDISNYFNSIDVDILLPLLRKILSDDAPLYDFFNALLTTDKAVYDGKEITEKRGVMAGTPTSVFLSNLYLKEMDTCFASIGAIYARYADDIIVFGTQEQIDSYENIISRFLEKYKLQLNAAKTARTSPDQAWTFLGFTYDKGILDISKNTKTKLEAKIRRQAKTLYRWKIRKNASDERALRAMNIKFNKKFYAAASGRELCWARWFFPLINTSESLKEIDAYMQQWQRYIVCGRHRAKNHDKAPYVLLKSCGYQSLVATYYAYKATKY